MAQKNRVNLTIQAAEIRDETLVGANTALRVGTMDVDIVDSFLNIVDDVALYDQSADVIVVQGNLDTHTADSTIHFTQGSIDHTSILNIGTNTHAQIDSHIADATIHFTEGSIDHTAITNVGTNTHAQIDTHIANVTTNPHAVEWVDLSDKDRVPQAATTVASATGIIVLDMSKSVSNITLTGNVTAISFSNQPSATDMVSALLNVYQDITGGWTMDWTGSGVYPEDGKVAADFQPIATASALTQYWLNWTGTYWVIQLIKVSATAL